MADSRATTGELYKAKTLTEGDIGAAVDAYMADPTTTAFLFGDGYRIDLAEAVRSHEWAAVTVRYEGCNRAPKARGRAHRHPARTAGDGVSDARSRKARRCLLRPKRRQFGSSAAKRPYETTGGI